jgi:cobalt/nickel transport system permease protein
MLLFVLAVVATPREAFWAFAIHAILLGSAIAAARIPAVFLLRRLLVLVPFVLFALFLPFFGGGTRTDLLGLSLSLEGLWGAWTILAKATLGVTASIVMAATTEVPDILLGLDRGNASHEDRHVVTRLRPALDLAGPGPGHLGWSALHSFL